MNKELVDWIICGRVIGKASGWDQDDTWRITLYDFSPNPEYKGPNGDDKSITIDFEYGTIAVFNEVEKIAECDLIYAIKDCPITLK